MRFRLAQASDLHLTGSDEDNDLLDALFSSLRWHGVDHLVVTGDITNDGEADGFRLLDQKRREYGFGPRRSTVLAGNHDLRGWPTFIRLFGAEFNLRSRSLNRGAVQLVTLDSAQWNSGIDGLLWNAPGWLEDEQLDELRETLSLVSRSSFTVAALHHHLFTARWDEAPWETLGRKHGKRFGPLNNAQELVDILTEHGVTLALTGHSHVPRDRTLRRGDAELLAVICGSTKDCAGFRIFDFQGSRLKSHDWVNLCLTCCEHETLLCDDCDEIGAIKCEPCEGSGSLLCDVCEGDDDECEYCDQAYEVDCPDCDASGVIACDSCDGEGEIRCPDCS